MRRCWQEYAIVIKLKNDISRKIRRIIWGRLTSALVRDSEGQPRYAIRTIEDITPQKQLQKELTNERERLAVTLGSISEGVVVTDEEGKIVLFNKAAEKITGWAPVRSFRAENSGGNILI